MKTKNITLMLAFSTIIFVGCSKEGTEKSGLDFGNEEAEIVLELGYTANVTTAIESSPDYNYITKGIIEYSQNGNVIATLDYGDGTKDIWAILTKNDINLGEITKKVG